MVWREKDKLKLINPRKNSVWLSEYPAEMGGGGE